MDSHLSPYAFIQKQNVFENSRCKIENSGIGILNSDNTEAVLFYSKKNLIAVPMRVL